MIWDHLATLRGVRGGFLWWQITAQFLLPVAVGVAIWQVGFRIAIVGELIAGFSVLAGFLFGLVIFVFQLRLGMTTDPRVQTKTLLPTLVDQLFSNVLYAVLVSFALIAVTVAAAATEPHTELTVTPATTSGGQPTVEAGVALGLEPWVSGTVIGLAVHLLAVIGMCLSRTRRAYLELKR
ncbi:hypothetical protein [Microbacterium sp.]|uniref:hypothetical protein n=1 Tax=Microbacterium sp. TaxID=51671 RepID=UPI0028AA032B|nr:hypothetical protein [Microbacterium sp.]